MMNLETLLALVALAFSALGFVLSRLLFGKSVVIESSKEKINEVQERAKREVDSRDLNDLVNESNSLYGSEGSPGSGDPEKK